MRKTLIILIASLLVISAVAQNKIAHTLHQQFASRIYFLNPDGSTITYYDYENYRLKDLTLVNDELYVADAFAPMVLKVDLETGALEQFIFDLWPTYYYGLASDGEYFYVEDWGTLYKYDMNGDEIGTLDFDETIYGMACDSNYLFTIIEDDNLIRCWDISAWPQINELVFNSIPKPSSTCRGLTYDGMYFWTAEAHESQNGKIYKFDHAGNIHSEIDSPTYTGWSACFIKDTTTTAITEYTTDQVKIIQDNATGQLLLTSKLKQEQDLEVYVFDMNVKLAESWSFSLAPTEFRKTLHPAQLSNGTYVYRIIVNGKTVYGGMLIVN